MFIIPLLFFMNLFKVAVQVSQDHYLTQVWLTDLC